MYAQLKNSDLLAFNGAYLNLIRMIHERFRNRFDKVHHGALRYSRRGGRVQLEHSHAQIPWASGILPEPMLFTKT